MTHICVRPVAGLLIFLAIFYLIITNTLSFISIFSNPHSGIPLSQSALRTEYLNHTVEQSREAVIPRKIHQIYHDYSGRGGNVPFSTQWMRLRDSCRNRNPGWEYKLWSTAESREFLEREYPWFLRTYDSYRHPVQRVDALKYFIMKHFGGIYIDMDNGCLESLESLRYYPAFAVDGATGPLSINILGSVPNHPFYEYLTNNIWKYNLFYYPFPYLSVSYNSGRWFFTAMWEQYHSRFADHDNQLFRVVMDSRRGAEPWVFWNEGAGLTWQDWDYSIFSWAAENTPLMIRFAAATASASALITGLIVWRLFFWQSRKAKKAVTTLLTPIFSPILTPLREKGKGPELFPKKEHETV